MNEPSPDDYDRDAYGSPTSTTLSSGYGGYGNFPHPADENLPEVVMDASPQALTGAEAEHNMMHLEEREPKYLAVCDDTPKVAVMPGELGGYKGYPATPASGTEATLVEERKICGLKRKAFFIVAVVLLVIIAAAIGGGVGGSKAAANKSAALGANDGQSDSAPTPTQPDNTTSSTTSSASPTVTFLNNQTGPIDTLSFQGFSGFNFTGNYTSIIHDEGGTDLDMDINSYIWLPNSTQCCVTFCANATTEGYLGWRCEVFRRQQASSPFRRIFVWCNEERKEENARCV